MISGASRPWTRLERYFRRFDRSGRLIDYLVTRMGPTNTVFPSACGAPAAPELNKMYLQVLQSLHPTYTAYRNRRITRPTGKLVERCRRWKRHADPAMAISRRLPLRLCGWNKGREHYKNLKGLWFTMAHTKLGKTRLRVLSVLRSTQKRLAQDA